MKYTVVSAIKERDYESKFGTMSSYVLALKDESGKDVTAKLSQKQTTPAPIGELEGHIEPTDFGPKFVKEKTFAPAAKPGWTPAPKDPAERASIERQVSLKGAIEFAGYVMAHGGKKTPMKSEDVIKVAQAFDTYLKQGFVADKPVSVPVEAPTEAEAPQEFPDDDRKPWDDWIEKGQE